MAYDKAWYLAHRNEILAAQRRKYQEKKQDPAFRAAEKARLRALQADPVYKELRRSRSRARYAADAAFREESRRRLKALAQRPDQQEMRRKRRGILDPERFDELFALQGRACGICKRVDSFGGHRNKWQADHDHVTGLMRGVLCGRCNTAIGQLADSPEICDRAAQYLRTPPAAWPDAGISDILPTEPENP